MSVYPENSFLSPLTLTLSPLGGERGPSSGTIFMFLMVPPFCGGMSVYPENRFLSPPLTLTLSRKWLGDGPESVGPSPLPGGEEGTF